MNQELKPCPFCGDPMRERGGLIQHVEQTEGCPIRQEAWDSGQIDRWNRRTDALEGGVTVKSLEWVEEVSGSWWIADAYRIEVFDGGGFAARVSPPQSRAFKTLAHGVSLEEAKAAAQADYERRILSALSAPAQRVEEGEPVSLAECPIGLFMAGDELCLKTEYGNNEGRIDAYIVSSGEFFWGSQPQTIANQRKQCVHPVTFAASPAPAPHAGVDDAMVERAKEALKESGPGTHHSERHIRTILRAALEDRT